MDKNAMIDLISEDNLGELPKGIQELIDMVGVDITKQILPRLEGVRLQIPKLNCKAMRNLFIKKNY
jgi:3-hydroxyacyl-CoA dehydrogenase